METNKQQTIRSIGSSCRCNSQTISLL
ncbi:hypothetical protein KSF78_0004499 [Schistosoma japonicum]|nr:hypothetical protein KSF78_0004499 [Schistosoma japonicum]